jgi:hypothetical protein
MPRMRPLPQRVSITLRWILSVLEDLGVEYQISGGLAARFYGATRSINDIDIDVLAMDISRIREKTKRYVIFGPELYIDSEWMTQLLVLRYGGQLIDLSGADTAKIFDENKRTWRPFRNVPRPSRAALWQTRPVKLIHPLSLMMYKRFLHGAHQTSDINAIGEFLHRERIARTE